MLSEAQYRSYGKEIIPDFLFLGCRYEADDPAFLREHGVTHVLNVAEECEPTADARRLCKVLHIPLRDSPRTDVRGRFSEAFAFIDEALASDGSSRVLVHCFEGRNRSAAFVLGYLIRKETIQLSEALARVRAVRSLVDPNIGFMKQLRDFELELLGPAALVPSLPIDEATCQDLLDLGLVAAEELGRYTDLAAVEYEGSQIAVGPPSLLPESLLLGAGVATSAAPGRGSAAKAKARAKGKSTASSARTAARGPSPKASAAQRGSPSPGARGRAADAGRRPRSPEPIQKAVPPPKPLADALQRLFDALDASVAGRLPGERIEEARAALVRAAENIDASAIRRIPEQPWGDGSQAAFQGWAAGLVVSSKLTDEQLEALASNVSNIASSIEPPMRPWGMGTDEDRQRLSEILPGKLFLTNWRRAADQEAVEAAGITHVLSMGSEFEGYSPLGELGIEYMCVVIDDNEDQADVMLRDLARAVHFLDSCIRSGGRALVHCAAGISRSATVVLAYLVAKQNFSLLDALRHTLKARPVIWPNTGFMSILIQWEESKRRKSASMRISQYKLWSEYNEEEYSAAKVVDRD